MKTKRNNVVVKIFLPLYSIRVQYHNKKKNSDQLDNNVFPHIDTGSL